MSPRRDPRAGGRSGNLRFAFVAIGTLLGLAALTGNVWLQAAGCGLTGLVIASWLTVWFDKGCQVTMHHGDFVVGEQASARFVVENSQRRRSRPIVIRFWVRSSRVLIPEIIVYVDPVAAGERVEVAAVAVPVSRGEAPGRWSVERVGAFGLCTARHVRTTEARLGVAPPAARAIALADHGAAPGSVGPVVAGLDVFGPREWRPGDSARHVHWRATARTGRLTVLERAEPARGAVGVLMAGVGGDDAFERVVAVAAATLAAAIDEGHHCYVWLEQDSGGCLGRLTRDRWLAAFAHAENVALPTERGVAHLLRHLDNRGSLLLVSAPAAMAALRGSVEASAAWQAARASGAGAGAVRLVDVAALA